MEYSDELHVELDVGNLLVSNIVQLDLLPESQGEEWLKSLAEKGTQLLLKKMWDLPCEYRESVIVAKLPEPTTKLPREKHVPKVKPPSRWEEYAKKKGIQHRKRDKLLWDETAKEWKPRWGYRGIKSDNSKWLVEVPDNADPNVDYFAKDKEQKTERVAKNEFQRLRNLAEGNKMKVRNMEAVDTANKEEISRSIASTKFATASKGKFVNKLQKEKPAKNLGKKRKFGSNFEKDLKTEKDNNLKILEEINKKRPKLDIQEAVQVHLQKRPESRKKDSAEKRRVKKKTHGKSNKKRPNQGGKNFKSYGKKGKGEFKKKK